GGWTYVAPRLETVLAGNGGKAARPLYVGRAEAASPAAGRLATFLSEQADLVDRALAA
ncbi:MAG: hypothetical protein V3V17_02410, partial [Alphaproteobacteria bacterium]